MQIRSVGSALTHADRPTDKTNLTGAFCDYAHAPKNRKKKKRPLHSRGNDCKLTASKLPDRFTCSSVW